MKVEELKKVVKRSIRLGHNAMSIKSYLRSNEKFTKVRDLVDDVVDDVVREYPDYGIIQKIVRSDLVCSKDGEDQNVIILDHKFRNVDKIHKQRMVAMFDSKYDFRDYIYTAKYEYLPLNPGLLVKNDDGPYSYNNYIPPEWLEDWFYSKGEIQPDKVKKIPKLYHKFLMHLVGNSDESYEYILKWLANGLKRKNYCILTTIGKQGIGKGVLGEIMRLLFGKENYYAGSDRMFKGTFNSQIANKRLVYCDEIMIREKEDEDRLKLVVNDFIEIEKKGVDAEEIKNYANFYISSNNMDSISLTADDRRFSIVDLTDTKLLQVMTTDEIRELLNPENVSELGKFLWHYKVDPDEMSKVFVTERTATIRAMGLKEWEEWFIMEYCPDNKGKTMKIHEAGEAVKEQFGYSTRVGRSRFMDLQNKYPDSFRVSTKTFDNKRKWILEILGDEDEV